MSFSVIRKLNSFQSHGAKRAVSSSSEFSKRCETVRHGLRNPCAGCGVTISEYSIAGVAILRAQHVHCRKDDVCFNGNGLCQKAYRTFEFSGIDGTKKTLELTVACICVR